MSQPSRAERRRQERGGAAPPPRRDPMRPIYIGVGIALLAIIVAFAGYNWWQKRQLDQAFATPTPGPNASVKPIQLTLGEALGEKYFKGKVPDTPQGGHGQTIDGVGCGAQEYATLHVHTHLSIYNNGKLIQVPPFVGFAPNPAGGCLYWIHTHDGSGVIHLESPEISPPQGGPFYARHVLRHLGTAVTTRRRRGLQGNGNGVRQRRQVRRRVARYSAGLTPADRAGGRNAAGAAAELPATRRRVRNLAQDGAQRPIQFAE